MKNTVTTEEMKLHVELLKEFVNLNGGDWSEYSETVHQQVLAALGEMDLNLDRKA